MKYIFEDDGDDALMCLFRAGYNNTSDFIYTQGKDKILERIKVSIPDKSEEIFIFMDLVFDNPDTVKVYNLIRGELKRLGYERFIIFPIVSTEYYLLKSLYGSNVIRKSAIVDICIEIGDYRSVISNIPYISGSKNFEKFCKRVLHTFALDCATNTQHNNNLRYRDYYDKDCLCGVQKVGCKKKTVREKAKSFLKQYPCLPAYSIISTGETLSWTEMIEVHKNLVDLYNEEVDKHRKLETDPERMPKYIKAHYMSF